MPIVKTALTVKDLPPPPPGKTGWPWTQQSEPLPEKMEDGSEWPNISIVTPSYNQGQFIEETIRSVLLQGYPNLEYIIIDGGSTDSSVEIIKKYEQYLAYWVSEPDRGQSHGINKGLEKCTGDYIAWMNSSDCYIPGAFEFIFGSSKANYSDFIFGCAAYGGKSLEEAQVSYSSGIKEFKLEALLRFFYSQFYIVPSQSVFISKRLIQKIGLLNEDLHYCMDFDWNARIALTQPNIYCADQPICFYRHHDDAKTARNNNNTRKEAVEIAKKYATYLSSRERKKLYRLIRYNIKFKKCQSEPGENFSIQLLVILMTLPREALSDTRFLGMLKRNLYRRLIFLI